LTEWREFNLLPVRNNSFYIKSSRDKVEISLDVLSDMLMHSKFDPAEIDKERESLLRK